MEGHLAHFLPGDASILVEEVLEEIKVVRREMEGKRGK